MHPHHPLVPHDKYDLPRAEAAVAAGLPAVLPILEELLGWLQDGNWPVARVLAPFLGTAGISVVPHVRRVLEGEDDIWKYWILKSVVAPQPDVVAALRPDLERITRQPTKGELEEGVLETATGILSATKLPERE
jgi:hypothetical protein